LTAARLAVPDMKVIKSTYCRVIPKRCADH